MLLAGIALLTFARIKEKPIMFSIVGAVALSIGGYYLYQSLSLGRVDGDWRITVDEYRFEWQSPAVNLDPSLSVALNDIEHVLVDSGSHRQNTPETVAVQMRSGERHRLGTLSGVNFEELLTALEKQGVQIRRKGN